MSCSVALSSCRGLATNKREHGDRDIFLKGIVMKTNSKCGRIRRNDGVDSQLASETIK